MTASFDGVGLAPTPTPIRYITRFDNVGAVWVDLSARPDPPTDIGVIAGDAQVTVMWVPPANHGAGILGYEVTATSDTGSVTVTMLSTSYVFYQLQNNVAYTFTVVSIGASGLHSYVISIDAVPEPHVLPPDTTPVYIAPNTPAVTVKPAPVYNMSIGDWKGGDISELTQISNRSMHFDLLNPHTLSFDISGLPDRNGRLDASLLDEGASDIMVRRNGVPLLLTRLISTSDNGTGSTYTISCSCSDYRELLAHRFIFSDVSKVSKTFNNMRNEDIIWQMIVDTQSRGSLGITKGLWPATTLTPTSQTFQLGMTVLDAISQLTKAQTTQYNSSAGGGTIVINTSTGFDFEIDPYRKANIYIPGKGQNVGPTPATVQVLDYGGAIASFTRSVDMTSFANYIQQTGKPAGYAIPESTTDLATTSLGRWETFVNNSDLPTADTVNTAAVMSLIEKSQTPISYNLTFAPDRWLGPSQGTPGGVPGGVWLGDMVTVKIDYGRLHVSDFVRVNEITINLDQNNRETVTVNCGRYLPRYIQSLKEAVKKLNRATGS